MITSATGERPHSTPWQGWLELVALVGFAISPLYDLLGRYPEILVANGFGPFELFGLSLVLSFVLPTMWILCESLLGLASSALGRGFHLIGVGIFSALTALLVVSQREVLPGSIAILVSASVGLAFAVVYLRSKHLVGLLQFLSLAAMTFPAMFLFTSPASDLIGTRSEKIVPAKRIERPAPVVVLLMDELPIVSLLNERGEIDPLRYPAFAEFAEDAIWFPNTATTAAYTTTAIPAILTGSYPERFVLLTTSDRFPNSLFSLLSDHYDMHSFEAITQLCAPTICTNNAEPDSLSRVADFVPDLAIIYLHRLLPAAFRGRLPSVSTGWKDFAETAGVSKPRNRANRMREKTKEHTKKLIRRAQAAGTDLAAFIDEIEADDGGRPTLHFFHFIKPHAPFRYLPSGRSYPPGPDYRYGLPNIWKQDPWESIQSYQRHLLQTGYADLQLGKLLDRLREVGIYDEALIAVIADHGTSFWPTHARRDITVENQAETALVPFFLKLPGQREGRVDTRGVATVDLLPTLADALGAELPWKVDGRSALTEDPAPRGDVWVVGHNREGLALPRARLMEHRKVVLARKLELFGKSEGNQGLYEIGFAPELLGRKAADIPTHLKPARFRVAIYQSENFLDVDPEAEEIPVLIAGEVAGPAIAENPVRLAIAVNGVIQALTQTHGKEAGRGFFEAMVPEHALRPGFNRIQVFKVQGKGARLRLQSPLKG